MMIKLDNNNIYSVNQKYINIEMNKEWIKYVKNYVTDYEYDIPSDADNNSEEEFLANKVNFSEKIREKNN